MRWEPPLVLSPAPSLVKIVTKDASPRNPIVGVMFEVVPAKRGRKRWEWRVCDRNGKVIIHGLECTRATAKYKGERALFLLFW
jgi:hypothetical protein